MKKGKLFILGLSILMVVPVLTGCGNNEEYNYSVKKVETVKAEEKTSDGFLVYSGNVEGKKETVMSAKTPGRIKEIKVDIGDEVKQNDLLVALTGEENFSQMRTANDAYKNSIAGLQNTENLMAQKIIDAEVNLKITEENLLALMTADKNTEAVSSEQIKDAELQLELAEINLKNIENTFNQKQQDIIDNISSTIIQTSILSNDVISYLYGINNEQLPDEENNFEIKDDFIVKSKQKITDTEIVIIKAKKSSVQLQEFYNLHNGDLKQDNKKLFEGRDLAEIALLDVKKALRAMNDVVSDSVTHSAMTQSGLDGFRNTLVQYSYSVENMLLSQDAGIAIGLIGARQAFDNINVEKNNSLLQTGKQVELTEQKIELLESGITMTEDDLTAKVEILKTQVEQARQSLETAKKHAESQIQMSKTQSDLARGSLGLANVGIANTQVRAPYNGVIVEKILEEGVTVSAGTPIIKVADISSLKLVVFVPESQIMNFEKGLIATATTDSFTGFEFQAVVERISPKSEDGSKKVRVEFSISDPGHLKLGMYMNLKVKPQVSNIKNIISVPFEAIQHEGGKNFIWAVNDNKVLKKEVEVGQSNELNVEISSGLELGENVVVRGFDGLSNNIEVEVIK